MAHPSLFLFRNDLRLQDNPALHAAIKRGAPILALYILDDITPGTWKRGEASRWWLHHSLTALSQSLREKGVTLYLRRGETTALLREIQQRTQSSHLYLHEGATPEERALDQRIHTFAREQHLALHCENATTLLSPTRHLNQSGNPFKIFTPFWRAALETVSNDTPLPTPSTIPSDDFKIPTDTLQEWNLLPTAPNWAEHFSTHWKPGETEAHRKLDHFLLHHLKEYAQGRDFPATNHTSALSPHLHFGEISARSVFHRTQQWIAAHPEMESNGSKYLSELGWREFSYYLLFHHPSLPHAPFRPEFKHFPWAENHALRTAWQQGNTGFPIIDAGMRELWKTGWMHNRVRMIVASFLTKHLRIHWQEGARWFWDTLLDADLANNSASWQWVAGCGADAAPYFRIFNPILQSQKYDPTGEYIRRFVPELKDLSATEIHTPWKGANPPRHYPRPILDLAQARNEALHAFKTLSHTRALTRLRFTTARQASIQNRAVASAKAEREGGGDYRGGERDRGAGEAVSNARQIRHITTHASATRPIFLAPQKNIPWSQGFAQIPTPVHIDDRIRVFYATRDEKGQSQTLWVDLDADAPGTIRAQNHTPILPLGEHGSFDEHGVMPACALWVGKELFLYYTGWKRVPHAPYELSIGLAISRDHGNHFEKHHTTPIFGISTHDPVSVTSPFVYHDGKHFHMLYASFTAWQTIHGRLEPCYHLRHCVSQNGIEWKNESTPLFPSTETEAMIRGTILTDTTHEHLWFCTRGMQDFRDGADAYRIGYASRKKGEIAWQRNDSAHGLPKPREPWETTMRAYPYSLEINSQRWIFYNGNGFGKEGFGYVQR